MNQEIYSGELVWERKATDIVDDARVIESNPEEDWLRVPEFCEPLVSRETWDRVAALRMRRRRTRNDDQHGVDGKQIKPLSPGLSLTCLLGGLVRCGKCGSSMRPVTSGRKGPNGKTYTYHACPVAITDGGCPNNKYVSEDWLRKTVVDHLMARLLPVDNPDPSAVSCRARMTVKEIRSLGWFQELLSDIQQEVTRRQSQPDCTQAALADEAKQLQDQQHGWTMSLANANLPPETRRLLEQQIQNAAERLREIEARQHEQQADARRQKTLIDPIAVCDRLGRLEEVLATHNPSLGNIELSLHIDCIDCFPEGRVVLRTCRLGVLAEAIDFLAIDERPDSAPETLEEGVRQVQPRRRSRRRIGGDAEPTEELKSLALWSTDPDRFANLDERWFEEHEFSIPESNGWYCSHAADVATKRAEGLSFEELASHFGCTVPTIRKALRHAVQLDPELTHLLEKKPRRRWHEDHSNEVAELVRQGLSVPAIARRFGKSEPTIRKAVEFASQSPVRE